MRDLICDVDVREPRIKYDMGQRSVYDVSAASCIISPYQS